MPELPEVEFARRHLARWCGDRLVGAVAVEDVEKTHGDAQRLVGQRCLGWSRRGKILVGHFTGGVAIVSHLAMTGKWVRDPGDRRFQRLVVTFESSSDPAQPTRIATLSARRLAQTWIVDSDAVADHPRIRALGPELFDPAGPAPRGAALAAAVGPGRGPVKTRLMDPKRVAGLGNICVVEGAFRAGLHPHRPVDSLSDADWQGLAHGIHDHIASTLAHDAHHDEIAYVTQGGDNPFQVYGRSGKSCPNCQTTIVRGALAGRPTFVCPRCQPEPIRTR